MSKNTLFNYFTKKSSTSKEADKPKKKESPPSNDCDYQPGDLVWARLEGYPWWPSFVCNHPTQNIYTEGKSDKLKLHVQFFDDPISRGWVKSKYIKPFKGSDDSDYATRGGQFYSTDPKCVKGVKEADVAKPMSREDRLGTFLVTLLSTDEESDEEPQEPIKFDNDIFDAEEEEESGKENDAAEVDVNSNTKRSPSKTPKKTPTKRARRNVKRRKIVESGSDCDDSEDEFKPTKGAGSGSSEESSGEESGSVSEATESEIDSPVKGVKRKRVGSTPKPRGQRKSGKNNGDGSRKRIQRIAHSSDEEEEEEEEESHSKKSSSKSPKSSPTKLAAFKHKDKVVEDKEEKMEEDKEEDEDKMDVDEEKSEPSETTQSEKKKKPVSSFFSPPSKTSKREAADEETKTPKMFTPSSKREAGEEGMTPRTPSSFTPSVSSKTKSKLSAFAANDTVAAPSVDEEGRTFLHNTLPHLQPDKIKDVEKRRPDHPDYDPRTLYVSPEFLSSCTPGMHQWWKLKSKYFDVVLFFKMGKFYELFHMDADVGVNELGLIYMKGDYAHSGFPEIAYGRYAETLIQKGYKVARIEQTETPDMMNERCKTMGRTVTKFDKVVRREVCSVQTKGTKRYSFLDGDASDTSNAYLLAICEREDGADVVGGGSTYGVCFVDTSIGKFHVGQFTDDRHCSRLRTLISHFPVAQLLIERGRISDRTQLVTNNCLQGALRELLTPGKEFWDSKKSLKVLGEGEYFMNEKEKDSTGVQWPDVIKQMMDEGDNLGQTAKNDYDLALSALGAITWYMQKCLIDQELFSMKNFDEYKPLDGPVGGSPSSSTTSSSLTRKHMVLDGITLANLEILENQNTGGREGTLLDRLDMCCTPFGRRLFKQWLCAPLCQPAAIEERLDAVEDLIEHQDIAAESSDVLKKLPDLERLLSKIHTLGSSVRKENHPDGRAVMYEEVNYGKKKIEDFLATLTGFKQAREIAQKFASVSKNFKSKLLKQVVTIGNDKDGRFPDLSEHLQYFDKAFDHKKAQTDGTIKPKAGMDPEYDQAVADVTSSKASLEDYLSKQKQRLGCKTLTYWGTGKNRYQLEVPDQVAKNVPDSYEVTSQKKGFKRYKTPDIEYMFKELSEAEERKDEAVRDCLRRIFFNFDKSYQEWERAVQCLSLLDVLISLAQYSRCGDGGPMCRPTFSCHDNPGDDSTQGSTPFLELRDARHPCIVKTFGGGDFIPNDTLIGCKDENDEESQSNSLVVLVTGPNMGGKSTLMRQVGSIVIMAQLGCYVPAEKCSLTPVDRVFTRLGASDRIMAGESTFFVELSETSAILQHATKHSLVLMDELGRGTATYDGAAIACAVVNELSQRIVCRSLFSTHYHALVQQFSHDSNVRTGHMACMVENENEEDPTQETITFLYKFASGSCPKSYGFNAARLANLPDEIIKEARNKAAEFEETVERLRFFRELNSTKDFRKLQEIQTAINA